MKTSCVFCGVSVPETDGFGLCPTCRRAVDVVCKSEDEIVRLVRYRKQLRSIEKEGNLHNKGATDDR